jgi:ketose-bisphosphate aldolase
MASKSMFDLYSQAEKEGYAIPAFNYSDIWDMLAIIEAAQEERAPIILSMNPLVKQAISVELCGALGKAVMERIQTPIIHHLDHGSSVEMCKEAINNDFPSVMFDGSKLSLENNIALTKEVVEYAHKREIFVEGEIGKIRGQGIEGDFEGGDFLVNVAEAQEYVSKSGVDSLAIGIGNAHGFYVGKPELNFKRLREVDEVVDIPLVLHGGTGIPKEDIQQAIKYGIRKINVGTIIHCTYMNNMRKELNRLGDDAYTLDVVKPVKKEIKKVIRQWIRTCMCDGKA